MARCACRYRKGTYQCKHEAAPGYTICDQHRVNCRRNFGWRETEKGTAWKLRFARGYPRDDADAIARMLHDENVRCAICGISGPEIKTLSARLGRHVRGGQRYNRRLTADRIDPSQPHVLGNTRILCFPCNTYRRDNRATDEGILIWARRQWQKLVVRGLLKDADLTWIR